MPSSASLVQDKSNRNLGLTDNFPVSESDHKVILALTSVGKRNAVLFLVDGHNLSKVTQPADGDETETVGDFLSAHKLKNMEKKKHSGISRHGL